MRMVLFVHRFYLLDVPLFVFGERDHLRSVLRFGEVIALALLLAQEHHAADILVGQQQVDRDVRLLRQRTVQVMYRASERRGRDDDHRADDNRDAHRVHVFLQRERGDVELLFHGRRELFSLHYTSERALGPDRTLWYRQPMRKLCLIIVDGFGVAPPGPGNARTTAKMPTVKRLAAEVPNVLMDASGNAVGLPEGQQGASEPGHLTIGAGRIVWQPLEEINQDIKQGGFFQNPVLVSACERAVAKNGPLHLIGLYSSGGVHSSLHHFHAMIQLAKQKGVSQVYLHLFGDGRDMPEQHFCVDFALLREEVQRTETGTVASLVGRYFAMDRDKQYVTRTKIAYDLLTQGEGREVEDVCAGARAWYQEASDTERTDYYIRPLKTPAFASIRENDTVVCINFRSDRMLQIVAALEQ